MRVVLLCCLLVGQAVAWDPTDFEVFDAVEEINANFYEVLGVAPVSGPGGRLSVTSYLIPLPNKISDGHVARD